MLCSSFIEQVYKPCKLLVDTLFLLLFVFRFILLQTFTQTIFSSVIQLVGLKWFFQTVVITRLKNKHIIFEESPHQPF